MKLFIKVLLFIVILACVAPFVMKDKFGMALMSLDRLVFPDISMPDVGPVLDTGRDAGVIPKDEPKTTTVYKWQDDQGIWHFSDDANPGIQSEVVTVDNNANIVSLETPAKPIEAQPAAEPKTDKSEKKQPLDLEDSVYEQVPELIDQAKNVENLLNSRQEQQQQVLRELGGT